MAKSKKRSTRGKEKIPNPVPLGEMAAGAVQPSETVELVEGFTMSVNGLTVNGKPPFDRWDEVSRILRVSERGNPMAIGDLFAKAEDAWGEQYAQLMDATEWSLSTLKVYIWTSRKIAFDVRRMDRLGIAHHTLVARMPPRSHKKWLDAAANDAGDPWSVAQLKAALQNGGETVPSGWFVLVTCRDERDQQAFLQETESGGRICKAVTKQKKAKEAGQ